MNTTIAFLLTAILSLIIMYFLWLLMAMKDKINTLETENNALAAIILQHIMSAKDDPGEQIQ